MHGAMRTGHFCGSHAKDAEQSGEKQGANVMKLDWYMGCWSVGCGDGDRCMRSSAWVRDVTGKGRLGAVGT